MEQLQWERLQDLFSRAVELSTDARDSFVFRETEGDPELRKQLLELLEFDTSASKGAITQALGAAIDATSREQREALVGKIIGNYRLVSVLGHGGTGTVYLAERGDRHYSGKVAIKLVHSAMVHGALGARFRAERQILASLDHANISRVLDAGETGEGQPYLVMEYVDGEPLDYYADRQALGFRDRLLLFLEICGAVQYAHQNLVVHRDLKPANILVTCEGVPKLLDFGIAKLLDRAGDPAAGPALTRLNDRLLTPEYASPEQILGEAITTASDVYALGVVLYELLAGLRPYPVPGSISQLELERLIRIADPERPSVAIRRLTQGTAEESTEIEAIAQARGLTAEQLYKRLYGDLDAIVMRALRKEPHHRYASVEQFAADIRRHLDNEPVRARQGNWAYYSQRFVRRHTYGVSIVAMFVAVAIAFIIVISIQTKRIAAERDRATQESKRAEAVSNFMLEVFSASDPFTSQGHETTARELLDVAAKRIGNDLTQQPEVRARLLEAMGKSYYRQNEHDSAAEYLQEALKVLQQISDADASQTAAVLLELARVHRYAGDADASEKTLQEVVRIVHLEHNERSLTYAGALRDLGRLEQLNGDLETARKYLESGLGLYSDLLGPVHTEVANTLIDLEEIALWRDDLAGAERLARQALDIFERAVPELHPDRVAAEADLGNILLSEGRIDEAAAVFERVLARHKLLFGETSRQVALTYMFLADTRAAQGLLDEAEKYSRQSLNVYGRSIGDEHYQTAFARTSLATILLRLGNWSEAEPLLRHSLKTYANTLPPDHQYVASAEYFLGEALLQEGRLLEAEATLTTSMNRWKRADAAPWRIFRSQSALGEVLYREGKYKDAERYLSDSYQALVSDEKADRDARIQAHDRIARFYLERGERQKLQTLPALPNQPIVVAANK
jgi:eukaryotic-like serine/threonine-protein kinase